MTENKDNKKPDFFYLEDEIKTVKDKGILEYRSKRLPVWCPGCGYFGITTALTNAFKELDIKTHNLLTVSGIGCAGRLPYFIKCYGIHSLHGRALPVATGAKTARPDLTVVAALGDGDGMSIGVGHLAHAARRNVDLLCILFDNNIYGLTKGQTSPTTPTKQITNSHPYGSPDIPIQPLPFALTVGSTYAARGYAARPDQMKELFKEGITHKGFSFVHIMSPCVTFDKVNFTYNRLDDVVKQLPENHDPTNYLKAYEKAIDPERYLGLFYKENKPTFRDELDSYQQRITKK
jgi:2-oxoglutarate/2-oxoacid ferredoxin oxidoreductase subunit beta